MIQCKKRADWFKDKESFLRAYYTEQKDRIEKSLATLGAKEFIGVYRIYLRSTGELVNSTLIKHTAASYAELLETWNEFIKKKSEECPDLSFKITSITESHQIKHLEDI